ncbi:MAG: acriflavine resistance protein B [Acidobacteria bacterium]|nr:MAG: acriflavine resistance protein B [Acidobacteriota bacterium]
MNLTQLALKWDRVTVALLIVALVAGITGYRKIPQAEDPGFIIRTALVQTIFPGAGPERVELLVTDKLEKVIQEIPEIDYISSKSQNGISVIYVHIQEKYKKMRPIWDSLRRKVDRAAGSLPPGVIGPFVNDEFGDVYGQIYTLTGEGFSYRELKDIADEVRDELLQLDMVAKVEITGVQDERVFVEFNNAKLAELRMTPYQLKQILESRNIIFPGGAITLGRERISLEPSGNFESVDEMLKAVIPLPNSRDVVYLGDLVTITRSYQDPPRQHMRYNGQPCLGLAISMSSDGNIVKLSHQVDALFQRVQNYYPHGIHFSPVALQGKRVHQTVREFEINLLQSVVIVMVVLLFSLGLRTGVLVASLIPMTIVITLLFIGMFHIGIDQISLASLLIALGMLVDNAIVTSESILVQIGEGVAVRDAALRSGKELARPLLTSSLITSTAFLPIYLAKSSTGEYCGPLAKVVAICLLSSWVLALTVIPLFCLWFLKVGPEKKKTAGKDRNMFDNRFYRRYRKTIAWLLKHRLLYIGLMTLLLLAASSLGKYIPKMFFPDSTNAIIVAEVETPFGSSIEYTEQMVKKLEAFMTDELLVNGERETGILNWAAYIGEGAPRYVLAYAPEPPRPNYAYLIINTTSFNEVPETVEQLSQFVEEELPETRTSIRQLPLGPPVVYPIEVRLSGKDAKQLYTMADDLKHKLKTIEGVNNIKDNWGEQIKKLKVHVDQERAFRAGLTSMDIAVSLQTMLSGIDISHYRERDKIIPITLRARDMDRNDIDQLRDFRVNSQFTGVSVPLQQVADLELVWEPSQIRRRDRFKTITVQAQLDQGYYANDVNNQVVPWIKEQQKTWPMGYRWALGGEHEKSDMANASIKEQLPFAGLIIVLLLVTQFNSFRKPVVLMSVIPFATIGVNIGLLVGHSYFGFMTLLGIISLCGIIINNANVLMDRIRIETEENGLSPQDAIIEASQRRLRPILLTTLTTVGGLIPLWLGGGPMWEPMAITIIFGLSFATVITLGMVPVVYSLVYRIKFH